MGRYLKSLGTVLAPHVIVSVHGAEFGPSRWQTVAHLRVVIEVVDIVAGGFVTDREVVDYEGSGVVLKILDGKQESFRRYIEKLPDDVLNVLFEFYLHGDHKLNLHSIVPRS